MTWYEPWLNELSHAPTEVAQAVSSLFDKAGRGATDLSHQARAWVIRHAPWLRAAGQWVRNAGSNTWEWINAQGQVLYAYTAAQLRAMWRSVQAATDMTWQMLKKIDWGQVVTCVKYTAAGIAVIALTVGAVYLVCVLAAPVFAALAALGGIVGGASAAALGALAVAVGVQQLATN